MRITVVEDNIGLAKGIAYRLQDAGHAVDVLHDGLAASEFLTGDTSDLIILDINLPGMDGLEILRDLRARNDQRPVVMLSARADTKDRVTGLDAGADDYLIKPFEMDELEARVRALTRRRTSKGREILNIGALHFDVAARHLKVGEEVLDLPRRELSVFECLALAGDRRITKSALLDYAYGTGADVDESVVEVYISRLRSRLKPHGVEINSARGLGYQLQDKQSS
ncbi:response regulator transcription factor [Litoreibacter sp.]|nr:response regulator transcription factor [Litoreibacter sp.]